MGSYADDYGPGGWSFAFEEEFAVARTPQGWGAWLYATNETALLSPSSGAHLLFGVAAALATRRWCPGFAGVLPLLLVALAWEMFENSERGVAFFCGLTTVVGDMWPDYGGDSPRNVCGDIFCALAGWYLVECYWPHADALRAWPGAVGPFFLPPAADAPLATERRRPAQAAPPPLLLLPQEPSKSLYVCEQVGPTTLMCRAVRPTDMPSALAPPTMYVADGCAPPPALRQGGGDERPHGLPEWGPPPAPAVRQVGEDERPLGLPEWAPPPVAPRGECAPPAPVHQGGWLWEATARAELHTPAPAPRRTLVRRAYPAYHC